MSDAIAIRNSELDGLSKGPSPFQSTLLQGAVSSGKSWLAGTIATSEKRAIYFSFDKPDAGLQNHPNYANLNFLNYFDPPLAQGAYPRPVAWNNFCLDVGMLEYRRKSGKLSDYYLILDSLKYAELAAQRQIMFDDPSSMKKLKMGGSEIYVANGWGAHVQANAYMVATLNRLFMLGDTIAIGHERAEEDTTSKSEKKRDRLTGKLSLDPPRLDQLKSLFLNKYRVESMGTRNWKVYTMSNEDFEGGTTLMGVSPVEDANLASLLQKDKAARMGALSEVKG